MSTHIPKPDLPPPSGSIGAIAWVRRNLFSSWSNTLLTLFAFYFLYSVVPPLIDWAFIKSDWVGDSREACNSGGACWVFVNVRFDQFMYGFYPSEEYWRINLAFGLLILLAIPLFIERFAHKGKLGAFILIVYPVIAFNLFAGGSFGLKPVETTLWGGLTLTLILSGVGIVSSLPLGIVLALGRRSSMPIVKSASVVFIEFWRGVPLITSTSCCEP